MQASIVAFQVQTTTTLEYRNKNRLTIAKQQLQAFRLQPLNTVIVETNSKVIIYINEIKKTKLFLITNAILIFNQNVRPNLNQNQNNIISRFFYSTKDIVGRN